VANILISRGAAVDGAAGPMLEEWLRSLEIAAEQATEKMYEVRDNAAAAICFANAKDYLHDAAALAHRLEQHERARHLAARLDHIKAVFAPNSDIASARLR
jgi:ubiquinone biosynthesis protein UbiJ